METNIQLFIELLITLSLASERLVEIIKGFIPWLNQAKQNTVVEARRKAILQSLAVVFGMLITYLTVPIVNLQLSLLQIIVIGLLVSGGSGFWNAILSYILQIKEIKKEEVKKLNSGQ